MRRLSHFVAALACVGLVAIDVDCSLGNSLGYINSGPGNAVVGPIFTVVDAISCCSDTVVGLDLSVTTAFEGTSYCPSPDNSCPGSMLYGLSAPSLSTVPAANQEGDQTVDAGTICLLSDVDNSSFNYHHTAYDYRSPDLPSTGCPSCGGGGGLEATQPAGLMIERIHRYGDLRWSSFGPGVYSNYDVQLELYGDYQPTAELFDPQLNWPLQLTVAGPSGNPGNCPADVNGDGRVDINDLTIVLANYGQNGMTWSQGCIDGDPTGTVDVNDLTRVLGNFGTTYTAQQMSYVDNNSHAVQQLVLYQGTNSSNVPNETLQTWTLASANRGVLTNYDGTTFHFDLIHTWPETPVGSYPDSTNSFGAVGWWKLTDGSGTTAADSSGHGYTGALSGGASWTSPPAAPAVLLDGSSGIVTMASGPSISGPITITAWVNLAVVPSDGNPHYVVSCCSSDGSQNTFLRVSSDGSSWEVGSSSTTSSPTICSVTTPINSTDVGNWVCLTGTYNSSGQWNVYRNGALAASASPTGAYGAISGGAWAIGAANSSTPTGYFNGMVNGVRLYGSALNPSQIATLAMSKRLSGRLAMIQDRFGNRTTIAYTYNWWDTGTDPLSSGGSPPTVSSMISPTTGDPTLQWRISTITDRYGQTATIDNCSTHTAGYVWKGGRWVVSSITFPGSQSVQYGYYDPTSSGTLHCLTTDVQYGRLGQVTQPDSATVSDFTFGTVGSSSDLSGQLTTVTFLDPMADRGHTYKTAYYSNKITLHNPNSNLWAAGLFSPSGLRLRMLVNGNNEVSYLNCPNTSGGSTKDTFLYQGGGKLRDITGTYQSCYYTFTSAGSWTVNSSGISASTPESTYAVAGSLNLDGSIGAPTTAQSNTGTFPAVQDAQGYNYTYGYNSAGYMLSKTYYAGAINSANIDSTEAWTYTSAGQATNLVSQYTDRLGHVVNFGYNSSGNQLWRQVGSAGSEQAYYVRDYYAAGNSAGCPANFLQTVYQPAASVNPDGTPASGTDVARQYVYTSDGRLSQVYEPDDAPGSTTLHLAYSYVYVSNAPTAAGFRQVASVTDATGHVTQYAYDACNRVTTIGYGPIDLSGNPQSTEAFLYGVTGVNTDGSGHLINPLGDNGANAAGKLLARKDRDGYVTFYRYDSAARLSQTLRPAQVVSSTGAAAPLLSATAAASDLATWVNSNGLPTAQAGDFVTTYQYLAGTELPTAVTRNYYADATTSSGQRTRHVYDYRQRAVCTSVYPSQHVSGNDLTDPPLRTLKQYVNNKLFCTTDPYGRSTFYNYLAADGRVSRVIRGTVLDGEWSVPANYAAVGALYPAPTGFTRDSTPNARYLITDYSYPTASSNVSTATDPNGNVQRATYDSRARVTVQVAGYGSTGAATTTTQYTANDDTVQAIYSPRSSTGGDGTCPGDYETFAYTRRKLRLQHTAAAGDTGSGGTAAIEYWTYNSDRTLNTHVDFNASSSGDTNHTWTTNYSPCCAGRVASQLDPLGTSENFDYDYVGHVVHAHTDNSQTYRETTSRCDSLGRVIAQTAWLLPLTTSAGGAGVTFNSGDPENAPIAGRWGTGVTRDGNGNATNGLTTQWRYIDNLALLAAGGTNPYSSTNSANQVTLYHLTSDGSASTFSVDLGWILGSNLIGNQNLGGGGVTFAEGAAGSAVVTLNPKEEISVTVKDAVGRTLATAVLVQGGSNVPVTWQLSLYDMGNTATFSSTGAASSGSTTGTVLETQQVESSNLPSSGSYLAYNFVGSYTDGAGRTLARTVPSQYPVNPRAPRSLNTMTYDANGNQVSVRDPNGVGWDAGPTLNTYTGYDALNRLLKKTDTASKTTQYAFDTNGNRLTLTDPSGNVTTWTYDARDRAGTESIGTLSRTFEYDKMGNLTVRVGRDGLLARAFGYNAVNQRVVEGWYSSKSAAESAVGGGTVGGSTATYAISMSYDPAHRMTNATDNTNPAGTAKASFADTYNYPSASGGLGLGDRVLSIAQNNYGMTTSTGRLTAGLRPTITFNQTFDDADRRTQVSAVSHGVIIASDFVTSWVYGDGAGRVTSVQQTGVSGGDGVAPKEVDFAYDTGDRLLTASRYAAINTTANPVAVSSAGYDAGDRLISLSHTQSTGGTALAGYTWVYDSGGTGLMTQMVNTDGTCNYTSGGTGSDGNHTGYDMVNRLLYANYGTNPPPNENYSYDSSGCFTCRNSTGSNAGVFTAGANDMPASGTNSAGTLFYYVYTSEGNRAAMFQGTAPTNLYTIPGSGLTNITTYTWDQRNRLTGMAKYADSAHLSSGSPSSSASYAYDHQNRLIGRSYNPDGAPDGNSVQTAFVYDGNQIVMHFEKTTAVANELAITNSLAHRYLWGPQVDQLLADEQVTSYLSAGTVVWPLGDHLNSVRDLATFNSTTNVTTIADHRVFDSYGNCTSETPSPSVKCLFYYTGRPLDSAFNLQYNLNRWYDPTVGSWLSEDPIGYDGGVNLYEYCGDDPLMETDPSGMDSIDCHCADGRLWREVIKHQPGKQPQQECNDACGKKGGFCWYWSLITPFQITDKGTKACAGYDNSIGTTCVRDGKTVIDPYPQKAKDVCLKFMVLYEESDSAICVANCLTAEEAKIIALASCEDRNMARLRAHFYCYAKCRFIPYKWFPEGSLEVGGGMFFWDYCHRVGRIWGDNIWDDD